MDNLLRHSGKGKDKHVSSRPDGYVRVYDMLQHLQWYNVNLDEFRDFLAKTQPGRFQFTLEPDAHCSLDPQRLWWMRKATYPKKQNIDLAQKRILRPDQLPHAVYKAPASEWGELKNCGIRPTIRRKKGLIVLSPRDYIEENTDPVNTSFIYISLDVEKALRAGVDFYKSRQANILSPGDRTGVIRPSLFKDVTQVDIEKETLK